MNRIPSPRPALSTKFIGVITFAIRALPSNINYRRWHARTAISSSIPNDTSRSIRILLDAPRSSRQPIRRISRRSGLAPLPPGATVARSCRPTGASDGGGRGERFPLVGPSERGVQTLDYLGPPTRALRGYVLRHSPSSSVATRDPAASQGPGHEQRRSARIRLGCRAAITVGSLAEEPADLLRLARAVARRCSRTCPAVDERIFACAGPRRWSTRKPPLVDVQRAMALRVARRIRQAPARAATVGIAPSWSTRTRCRSSNQARRAGGWSRIRRSPGFLLPRRPHPIDERSR